MTQLSSSYSLQEIANEDHFCHLNKVSHGIRGPH